MFKRNEKKRTGKMKLEDRFQHEFIMWFGQTYVEYDDRLFEVNNNPKNKAHGIYRKAMGMKKSVSDLILQQPVTGILIGIECKAPGTKHSRDLKILPQLEWGLETIKNGGYYIMTSNMDLLKRFTYHIINNNKLQATEIQNIAIENIKNQLKNKTIKF